MPASKKKSVTKSKKVSTDATVYLRMPRDIMESIDLHADVSERSRNFIINKILKQAVDKFIATGAF